MKDQVSQETIDFLRTLISKIEDGAVLVEEVSRTFGMEREDNGIWHRDDTESIYLRVIHQPTGKV